MTSASSGLQWRDPCPHCKEPLQPEHFCTTQRLEGDRFVITGHYFQPSGFAADMLAIRGKLARSEGK